MNARKATFRAKFQAWWHGTDVAEPADEANAGRIEPGFGAAANDVPVVQALEEWENARIRIAQLVWGAGFDKPGMPERVQELIAPCELDDSKSVLVLGCGLGGEARLMSSQSGASVTGYEVDEDVVKAARHLTTQARLERKVEIQRFVPDDFKLEDNSVDCFLALECLHRFERKYDIIATLQKALRARGHFVVSEFALADGVDPKDVRLRKAFAPPVDLWRLSQYEQRLGELGLELRSAEDVTDRYRASVLGAWSKFAQGDALTLATARQFNAAVTAELNVSTHRLTAIENGLIRVVQVRATKRAGPKLMSGW